MAKKTTLFYSLARGKQIPGNASALKQELLGGDSPLAQRVKVMYDPWHKEFNKERHNCGDYSLELIQLTEATLKALVSITPGADDNKRDVAALYGAQSILVRVLLIVEARREDGHELEAPVVRIPHKTRAEDDLWQQFLEFKKIAEKWPVKGPVEFTGIDLSVDATGYNSELDIFEPEKLKHNKKHTLTLGGRREQQ